MSDRSDDAGRAIRELVEIADLLRRILDVLERSEAARQQEVVGAWRIDRDRENPT